MPLGSKKLREVFNIKGVNMLYLRKVLPMTKYPHIKEICLTEMLAISCSKIFRKQIVDLVLDIQK